MNSISAFVQSHQAISLLVAYYITSAFTASLPAPTKDSSPLYVFSFRFVNILAANVVRAYSSHVENSPNFKDAIELHKQKENGNGDTSTTAKP